jgi:putative peptidoglycan lipid II flippase
MAALLKRIVKAFVVIYRQPILALAIINVMVALLAFIKDITLAAYAGTSLQADALTLAYFLPDSLGNNMFAAAISVVCVPVFSRIAILQQFQRLRKSVKQVSARFLLIAFLVMFIAYGLSGKIIYLLIGSTDTELTNTMLPLFRMLLPTFVMFVVIELVVQFCKAYKDLLLQRQHLYYIMPFCWQGWATASYPKLLLRQV